MSDPHVGAHPPTRVGLRTRAERAEATAMELSARRKELQREVLRLEKEVVELRRAHIENLGEMR